MIRNRTGIITALSILLVVLNGNASGEDVVYGNPFDLSVQGRVVDSPDGLFRTFPDEYDLDLNRDGLPDLRFRHTLTPRSRRVNAEALDLLQTAEEGIRESLNLVLGMRRVAIDAANEGVNDQDALEAAQAEIENALDTIGRIATQPFRQPGILDGSYGLQTTASSHLLEAISATNDTRPDSYAIEVTTRAERAFVEASTAQSSPLASDETLVINGVGINLNENMSQHQVIDRINEFASQTGVFAGFSRGSATQLYTESFGAYASLYVVANRVAAADSSGFGTTKIAGAGQDVIAMVGSNAYSGRGDAVVATGGSERGLSFRVLEDSADQALSVGGSLGTIDVTNNSPVFVLDEQTGESVSFTIPNILPAALGQGISGNQFWALDEIRVSSARQANDSLQIIDKSLDQLSTHQREILDFISMNALPYGSGILDGLNGAEFALAEFGLLPGGIQVGANLDYQSDPVVLQDSSVFRDVEQSGFVGVRVPAPDGWSYGWIGIEVEGDSSIQISDYVWNTMPNETVVTGVASERSLDLLLPGDANMDGNVGFVDFLILSENFGQPGRWHHGNFNLDQLVSFDDFLVLSGNFGSEALAASVPEPDAEVLFALVILLAGICRQKRDA